MIINSLLIPYKNVLRASVQMESQAILFQISTGCSFKPNSQICLMSVLWKLLKKGIYFNLINVSQYLLQYV